MRLYDGRHFRCTHPQYDWEAGPLGCPLDRDYDCDRCLKEQEDGEWERADEHVDRLIDRELEER